MAPRTRRPKRSQSSSNRSIAPENVTGVLTEASNRRQTRSSRLVCKSKNQTRATLDQSDDPTLETEVQPPIPERASSSNNAAESLESPRKRRGRPKKSDTNSDNPSKEVIDLTVESSEKVVLKDDGQKDIRPASGRKCRSRAKRSRDCMDRDGEEPPNHSVSKRRRPHHESPDTFGDNLETEEEEAPSKTRGYCLGEETFDASKFTTSISHYDECKRGDILAVPEYASDIFQRLFEAESRYNIQNYMGRQKSLTVNMRTILIDWIVEVHKKFRLVPDVLYLCVNIVDRYLSQVQVARKRLQLVGITSLLIACKYEEIYPPEVRDCVYVTDRAYTRQEVLDMEVEILKELGFRISVPTSYPFLQRFLFITDASPTMKIAASYYLERVLQEYDLIDYRPSVIAAAAVCLSLNHTEIRAADGVEGSLPRVPAVLLQYTGFSVDEVVKVARIIGTKLGEVTLSGSKRKLHAVRQKYSGERFQYVSTDFKPPDANALVPDDERE